MSYLTVPMLQEYANAYLAMLGNIYQAQESTGTERETAAREIAGFLGYVAGIAKVNPEFVHMDAVRYRLAVETLVAKSNDRDMTSQQQALFDTLAGRPDAPFSVEEFSSWIDEAMQGRAVG